MVQLNIFSGLNNLQDISMVPRYADLCGISENDLHRYSYASVQELAVTNRLTKDDCYAKLAQLYDGYHFSENSIGIYNPFSLLNTLSSKRFMEYWHGTGTPTSLTVALNPNRSLDTPGLFSVRKMRLSGILPASVRILFLATPRRSPLRLRLGEKHAA